MPQKNSLIQKMLDLRLFSTFLLFSLVAFLMSESCAYAFLFLYTPRQQAARNAAAVIVPTQRPAAVSSPVFGLSLPDVPPDVDVSLPDW